MPAKKIAELLGDKAEFLLNHQSKTISKEQLHLPGPDFVDRIWGLNTVAVPLLPKTPFTSTRRILLNWLLKVDAMLWPQPWVA